MNTTRATRSDTKTAHADLGLFPLHALRAGIRWSKLALPISLAGLVLALGAPHDARADLDSAVATFNSGQYEKAIAELASLANAGDSRATYVLGLIYTEGKGVPADYEKAAKWFQAAAHQDNSDAQYSLGVMMAQGKGVPKDLVSGLAWINIAARDPNKDRLSRLQIISTTTVLKRLMTPEQIAEANRRAAAWKPARK